MCFHWETDSRFPYEGGNNDTNPPDWRMRQDLRTPRAYWKSSATKGKTLAYQSVREDEFKSSRARGRLESSRRLGQSIGINSKFWRLKHLGFSPPNEREANALWFSALGDRRTKMLLILWGYSVLQKSNHFRTSPYERFIKKFIKEPLYV